MFKYLPERLRNRQALSSSQINRKRAQTPTPTCSNSSSAIGNKTPPLQANMPEEFNASLPQRASTFPLHVTPNREATVQNFQDGDKSVENTDSTPNGPFKWTHAIQGLFGPSPSTPQVSSLVDGEKTHLSSPSLPAVGDMGNQQSQTASKQEISFSPPFNGSVPLPDLMPMMFPSDDPLAYPNQPMSTLEDDHFKQDSLNKGSQGQLMFSSNATIQSVMESDGLNKSNSSSSPPFANTPGLSIVTPGSSHDPGSTKSLPPHIKAVSTAFPGNAQSPTSGPQQGTNAYPYMGNPDLVTIPGHSFIWQNLAAQGAPNNSYQYPTAGPPFQTTSDDFVMGLGAGLDMALDTDIKFDNLFDQFGGVNTHVSEATNGDGSMGASSNDWTQWGNWNSNSGGSNNNNNNVNVGNKD